MSDFKPLKPFPNRSLWQLRLTLWWHQLWPVKAYHEVNSLYRRLKRAYHWAKFMWTNWDFDSHSIFPLLEYKLKRIQHCLLNGCALYEEKHLKALRAAIKLAGRLSNQFHEDILYDAHEKKWGEFVSWTTVISGSTMKSFHQSRVGVKTSEDRANENKDRLAMYDAINRGYERDKRIFFAILQKYMEYWWD